MTCCGCAGRTIVFADTKNDTDETALELSQTIAAKALHGDIAQSQREVTLRSFKEGNFSVLVATDVAARGLDISSAAPPSALRCCITTFSSAAYSTSGHVVDTCAAGCSGGVHPLFPLLCWGLGVDESGAAILPDPRTCCAPPRQAF